MKPGYGLNNRQPKIGRAAAGAITAVLILAGCTPEQPWEPEIMARVCDRSLTTGELSAWAASLRQGKVPQEARAAYIRRWVEDEILYQEAVKQGLADDPWVVQRLDQLQRELVTLRLLEQENSRLPQPSASAAQAYFEDHAAEYIWQDTHLKIEYWRSDDMAALERLRNDAQRGRQVDLWPSSSGLLENRRLALDGLASADPQVWNTVSKLKVDQVSPVTVINGSGWVFKLLDRREAGEPQGLEDVRDDIIARLIEQDQRRRREQLTRELMDQFRREGHLQWAIEPPTIAVAETLAHVNRNEDKKLSP